MNTPITATFLTVISAQRRNITCSSQELNARYIGCGETPRLWKASLADNHPQLHATHSHRLADQSNDLPRHHCHHASTSSFSSSFLSSSSAADAAVAANGDGADAADGLT